MEADSMSSPPRPMTDHLVEEILLRIPPADSPASLVRAGLVCKRWCHLVSDPGFHHRLREFHRRSPPPMVGFLTYSHGSDATRFVPTSASGGQLRVATLRGLKPCDSRHGRVLLHTTGCEHEPFSLVIWNPITGEQLELPEPPPRVPYHWTAAVLCAAAAASTGGTCDHLNCHCGPFIVVIVGTTGYVKSRKTCVCIYNSEVGAWSEPAFARYFGGSIQRSVRSTLVGNTLYFALRKFVVDYPYENILEYDLVTRVTSVVKLPKACKSKIFGPIEFTTMEMEDGRLGFVRVEDDSRLCLWSRNKVGESGWVLCKAIRLADLLPFHHDLWKWDPVRILVGSAEGVGIILLECNNNLFTVDLRSGQMTKVYTYVDSCLTVPYINFCTPVFRAPSSLEGPRMSTSSDT